MMITVVSEFKDASGKPLKGTVELAPIAEWADGLGIIPPASVSMPANGQIQVEASNIPYRVTENIDGLPPREYAVLLNPGSGRTMVALSDLPRACVPSRPWEMCGCGLCGQGMPLAVTKADGDLRWMRQPGPWDRYRDYLMGEIIWWVDPVTRQASWWVASKDVPAGTVPPAGGWVAAPSFGAAGPKGDMGPPGNDGRDGRDGRDGSDGRDGKDGSGVTIKGDLHGAGTPLPPGPAVGDMWILGSPAPNAAPNHPDGTAKAPGDGIVWDGTKWTNVGPIRGPKGDKGDPGPAGRDGVDGHDGQPGAPGADGAGAGAWDAAKTYPVGALVDHQGAADTVPVIWIARQGPLTGAATEPGLVPGQWLPVNMVQPDSGWRDVTASAAGHGWSFSQPVKIRRVGTSCFLRTVLDHAGPLQLPLELLTLPEGWRGAWWEPVLVTEQPQGTPQATAWWYQDMTGSGQVGVGHLLGTWGAAPRMSLAFEWGTWDDWPVSLPGTATTAPTG